MHRVRDAAFLDPKPAGTARVVARHVVHATAHQFGDQKASTEFLQHSVQIVTGTRQARSQHQVVRSARIAGGFHAQFARGIAAQKVALHAACVDHLARLHAHALLVKR